MTTTGDGVAPQDPCVDRCDGETMPQHRAPPRRRVSASPARGAGARTRFRGSGEGTAQSMIALALTPRRAISSASSSPRRWCPSIPLTEPVALAHPTGPAAEYSAAGARARRRLRPHHLADLSEVSQHAVRAGRVSRDGSCSSSVTVVGGVRARMLRRRRCWRTRSRICWRDPTSAPTVGSSRNNRRGECVSAIARCSLRCWPPLSCSARMPVLFVSPSPSITAAQACAQLTARARREGERTPRRSRAR